MKAIAANSINLKIENNKTAEIADIKSIKEGVFMNLISNIMIKDNDKTVDSKKIKFGQHEDFNTYEKLEFKNIDSSKNNSNQYFELLCNRLI